MIFLKSHSVRIISAIILSFFLWTFGGLCEIAYAIQNSSQHTVDSCQENPTKNTQQSKTQKPEEKFQKAIEEIGSIVQRVQEVQTVEDRENEKGKLRAKRLEIEKLDKEIRKQFAKTEKKLKDAKLPDEILQRHYKFVRHYQDNLNQLRTNLNNIDKAKTKYQIEKEIERTKAFLGRVKPPKKHVPLDPNKLPHRTAEPIFKEPRTKPEEFTEGKELRAKSIAQKPILIASNGSLNGLLAQNSELLTPNLLIAQANNLPTDADLAETIEVKFTPEIQAKAQELGNNPVKIYEYVRNNFEYEPYYGSLKGANQTLLEMAGNDFDQASLLIALLRAANIPARYVYGTVEIPIEDIKNWLGIDDTNMALTALSSSGIPLTALTSGGTVVSVQLEHVGCQAFVPFVQSRETIEGSGDTWVDIDPSFKSTCKEIAQNVELPTFDQSQYLLGVKQNDPIGTYESDIQTYLDTTLPNYITEAVKMQKEIETQWFEFLLGTLPYDIIASTTFTAIPDTYRYKITFSATDEETELFGTPLTYTITTPEIAGKRVSLSCSPATDADTALVNQYGGLYNVPAYLLQLKPELRIAGEIKASGSAIGFGKNQYFKINFRTPYGKSDTVENIVIAGGYYVPVIDLQTIPEHQVLMRTDSFRKLDAILQSGGTVALDDYAGEILHLTGLAYFQKLNATTKNAEQILKVVDVKGISEAIISIDVSVDYVFGIPTKISLSSIGIDVDRNIHLPIPIDGNTNKKKEFMILTGMTSSFFEHKVLEDIFATESVSAIKIIQIANERGIPVYILNSGNISTYINTLQVSDDVKTDILNAVNAGMEVTIPQQELRIDDWFGTGYIVMNPQTGAGAYMISGGLAGGSFSVWSLNIPYSYNVPTTQIANATDNTLSFDTVTFPRKDDLWFTQDDVTYPLIDLIRLPEAERYNYYDPHPDRGDSGLIKINETNKSDNITSFLKLENFASKVGLSSDGMRRSPYLRLHPSLIYALQRIKEYTLADTVNINHGYRTVDHYNDLIRKGYKAEKDSWHMDGLASDIYVTIPGKTSEEAYNKLVEVAKLLIGNGGGVGCYPVEGFVHIDTRGTPARWGSGCK